MRRKILVLIIAVITVFTACGNEGDNREISGAADKNENLSITEDKDKKNNDITCYASDEISFVNDAEYKVIGVGDMNCNEYSGMIDSNIYEEYGLEIHKLFTYSNVMSLDFEKTDNVIEDPDRWNINGMYISKGDLSPDIDSIIKLLTKFSENGFGLSGISVSGMNTSEAQKAKAMYTTGDILNWNEIFEYMQSEINDGFQYETTLHLGILEEDGMRDIHEPRIDIDIWLPDIASQYRVCVEYELKNYTDLNESKVFCEYDDMKLRICLDDAVNFEVEQFIYLTNRNRIY